jgi:hypothetical protein
MTKYTRGQITVYSKEQIIYWFEQANYQDCRINAYPTFISEAEEQDYKQGINLNLLAPNILFIDLDLEHFKSKEYHQDLIWSKASCPVVWAWLSYHYTCQS